MENRPSVSCDGEDGKAMSERIVLRTGEALVEGSEDYLCAEPEVVIGELDGPVGHALANLIGGPGQGALPRLRDLE
jgi:formaldehyde-activating enzyme involved in methanogenesis